MSSSSSRVGSTTTFLYALQPDGPIIYYPIGLCLIGYGKMPYFGRIYWYILFTLGWLHSNPFYKPRFHLNWRALMNTGYIYGQFC